MKPIRPRWNTGAIVAVLIVSIGTTGLADDGLTERVVVRQAHWPVRIRAAHGTTDAGACEDIPADAVTIRRGGIATGRVTGIAPRPMPRIHALLIDTSHSMRTRIEAARTAALDYLAALPDGDLAMAATFDDTLVLRAPPTEDHSGIRDLVAGLETGYETAMWDATYDLLRFLETLPHEKILVLITDGEDSSSVLKRPFARVSDLAESIENLSFFAIGIDLPPNGSRGSIGALTGRTGGEFFEIEDVGDLTPVLRRIERRLAERTYVAYVPEPDSDGTRLSVRLDRGLPCVLQSLSHPDWRARARAKHAIVVETDPAPRVAVAVAMQDLAADLAIDPDVLPAASWCVETPGGPTGATGSCLHAVEPPAAIVGRLTDLVADAGPLYGREAWLRNGKLRRADGSRPTFAARDIAVLTPPLDEVRRRLRSPADVLRHLLSHSEGDRERPPFWIHGRTFLESRTLIGRALLGARDDYLVFARERVAAESPRWIEAFLRGEVPGGDVGAELLAAVTAERTAPGAIEPLTAVTAWLGDVDAAATAAVLEAELILAALSGTTTDADRAVAEAWPRLATWLSPGARVRILTPLVPAYDPDADVVGFYRVLLPWPRYLRPGPPVVPSRPFGLIAARWVVRHGGPLDAEVIAVRHGTAKPPELHEAGCGSAAEGRSRRAIVDLVPVGAEPGTPAVELVAYFGEVEDRPSCVDVRWDPRAEPNIRALGAAVRERAARVSPGP